MRWAPLILGFALSSCAPAGEWAGGEGGARPTIVSLNPCSDAVLAEVADPTQILAISHFSQDSVSSSMDLKVARRFRATSGSAEEVLALSPDVVVADEFLPVATRAALVGRGIALVELPIVSSVAQGKEQVLQLARLAGREKAGVLLNARIDAALARAAAPGGAAPVPALVWQGGGIVPGGNTLVADLLARTGFTLQSAARGMGQADYLPLEEVVADPPAVLLVAGDAGTQENRLLTHPALASLATTRRAALDPSLLWCGGPTIIRAAERLARIRRSL